MDDEERRKNKGTAQANRGQWRLCCSITILSISSIRLQNQGKSVHGFLESFLWLDYNAFCRNTGMGRFVHILSLPAVSECAGVNPLCLVSDPYTPSCGQTWAGQLLSDPSLELYSGVRSYPFSAAKPPTIVCQAWNEPTQRSIKPGSSQPT